MSGWIPPQPSDEYLRSGVPDPYATPASWESIDSITASDAPPDLLSRLFAWIRRVSVGEKP